MTQVERVVTRYKQMWMWIRDNLDSLRSKYEVIGRAKLEYRKKHDMIGWGDCILCTAYLSCIGCPLGSCVQGEAGYGTVNHYWQEKAVRRVYGLEPPTKEEAMRACDIIIAAHDELIKNPTKELLDKLEVYPWAR